MPGAPAVGEPAAAPSNPEETARLICARQLELRARSRGELATTLKRRGVPDDAAESVLSRFTDIGLIDDQAFAQAWVQSRHTGRGLGRRALAVELRRKGVTQELIDDALDPVDAESERTVARGLAERKLRSMPGDLPSTTKARRLSGLLARRGFPADIALSVTRESVQLDGSDETGAAD